MGEFCQQNSYHEEVNGMKIFACAEDLGAGVVQLVSARLTEQEVPSSILGDSNVFFDLILIRVAIALNTL